MAQFLQPEAPSPSAIIDRYLDWRASYTPETDETGFDPSDVEAEERLGQSTLQLETWLLGQAPTTVIEAICLLDVAAENLADGGRSDRADYRTLARIQRYLAALVTPADSTKDLLEGVRLSRFSSPPASPHPSLHVRP